MDHRRGRLLARRDDHRLRLVCDRGVRAVRKVGSDRLSRPGCPSGWVSVPTLLVSVVLAYGHDYTEHVFSDGRSVVVDRHAGLIPCDVRLLQRDGIHIVPVSHAPEDATCATVPEDDLIMGKSDGTVSIIIGDWEETIRLR